MGEYEDRVTRVWVGVPIIGPLVGPLPLRRLQLAVDPCYVGSQVGVFDHKLIVCSWKSQCTTVSASELRLGR